MQACIFSSDNFCSQITWRFFEKLKAQRTPTVDDPGSLIVVALELIYFDVLWEVAPDRNIVDPS